MASSSARVSRLFSTTGIPFASAGFNAVLGFWFPTLEVVRENYMRVRELRRPLKDWVDGRVQAVIDGDLPDPEGTFVYYWLKNGGQGENFRRKDIVFSAPEFN